MKIEISFPGQDVQIVDAQPNIVTHFLTKGYELPFVCCVSTIKPITLWSRLMKDKQGKEFWDFNHLEDGHCEAGTPTLKHPSHAQVWNGKWKKEHAFTIDGDGWGGSPKVYHIL